MKNTFQNKIDEILTHLGITTINSGVTTGKMIIPGSGEQITSISPIDNREIASVNTASFDDYDKIVQIAQSAFKEWRTIPAPKRGEIVRQIGLELRKYKDSLGALVTIEMGKILQEGLGEVQEMIDICDFAVGQSRQLYGFTMQSEREQHRMFDQYHPLGPVGVVSAFNFPVAVWSWNAMIAAIAGDVIIWKPSSKTPLTAIAVHNIIRKVLTKNQIPEGVFNLAVAKSSVLGNNFFMDKRLPLISLTGSCRVGQQAGGIIGGRLGKAILELGGNNAIIITNNANLKLAIPAIVFGAVGTAGQRCTSTRRIIIHEKIYDQVINQLTNAYKQIEKRIGNPMDEQVLMGPLIDKSAVADYQNAIKSAVEEGGKILFGNKVLNGPEFESGTYVLPTLIEVENNFKIVQEETFAPILYLIKYKTRDEAISLQNDVPQGLSSAIFTDNLQESEYYLSQQGSDCGIANVNIGTSGAEIGGAFGGEKDTGGGRESGSDAWKAYMRRQTNTINYSQNLPLAQGIKFDF